MKRAVLSLLLVLFACISAHAQQSQPQPLTFWYDYTINAGKEDQFMDLVKTVGAPVRDKLMADGVILAWGMETPLLRARGQGTHLIWFAVNDWSGIEKVDAAMRAQLAKLAADDAKSAEGKKGKPGPTIAERSREAIDGSKTVDYLTRDLVAGFSNTPPPAGALPFTRYNFTKVKPGKAADYRKAWEKYNKPVLDKLIADGTIAAYGLAVEEVKTTGDFTHFTWYAAKDLAGFEKVRSAFIADRDHRTEEERNAINDLFTGLTDPDAARAEVTRSLMFHVSAPK